MVIGLTTRASGGIFSGRVNMKEIMQENTNIKGQSIAARQKKVLIS
jgi:hypothetical protein